MRLRAILGFEIAYQLRRVSTWLYAAALAVLAFALTSDRVSGARNGEFVLGAPFVIAEITVIGCVVLLLVGAYVAGDAAARDVETGMHPFAYTVPVSRTDYLAGRFLAALIVNALILIAVPAGILVATYWPGVAAAVRGPFRLAAFVTAYLCIALPNAIVATASQFSFAALGRRAVASYVGGLVLLVISAVAGVVSEQVSPTVGRLLDPLGLTAFDGLRAGLTPITLNTRLVALNGTWLTGRLLWLGAAVSIVIFTHSRFRFRHHTGAGWWRRIRRLRDPRSLMAGDTRPSSDVRASAGPPIALFPAARTFGLATHTRQALAIGWAGFGAIVKSWGGRVLLAIVALFAPLTVLDGLRVMGVPMLPSMARVLHSLLDSEVPPAHLIVPLVIVFSSGELAWRDREVGLSEMADAAPVPDWVLLVGNLLGLTLVLAACMTIWMAAGVLVQVSQGYPDLEITRYVQALFGFQLTDYLFLALLALILHAAVNQKHIAHLVVLVAIVCAMVAPEFGLQHHLLAYGSGPAWSYTDMRGFGGSAAPWSWFKLYWASWALLLMVGARLLGPRGLERRVGTRLRMARRRFTRPTMWSAATAVALVLATGGFVFYNTNILNAYTPAADQLARRAEYEQRYGKYADIPQPRLSAVELRVELYPKRHAAEIRGRYRLINRSAAAIDAIHVTTVPGVVTGPITFDRPATPVVDDKTLGYRLYELKDPLAPGDSAWLDFEVHVEPRGFRNGGVDALVVANGTHLTNDEWSPAIGYQRGRELGNAWDRQAHGLPPRPAVPSVYDMTARERLGNFQVMTLDAVVGTEADQTAVVAGVLRRTWMEGGRRYFHYVTDVPIGNEYAISSATYAVRDARWRDVAIQIFHDPAHTANLDRTIRSVQASLSYDAAHFGPYPYQYLRLIEHPSLGSGLHSEAANIWYDEGFSFMNPPDPSRGFDLVAAVVAHEVGHQWWGAQLPYAPVEGAALLSESLAWYSAMRVVEAADGEAQLRRLLGFMRTQNPAPPRRAAPPLLQASDRYAAYRRGPFAMYALSEYIGVDRVNRALRQLLAAHRSGAPPLATSLDLYRALQTVTPDSLQYLVHDLFEANTWWELETTRAAAKQTDPGAWQVTLDVRARKVVVDTAGVETEVPMDDWVPIGVFAAGTTEEELGEPLSMRMHRIHSGEQTIMVTVPRTPGRAGIDPNHLLMDPTMHDNVRDVTINR